LEIFRRPTEDKALIRVLIRSTGPERLACHMPSVIRMLGP
jgi:hypothetical protein